MKDNGLDIRNEWIFNNVHTIEDGEQIGKILLRQEQLPDAIFTGSDEVALGLMDFMTAHQINILTKSPLWDMITNPFLVFEDSIIDSQLTSQ